MASFQELGTAGLCELARPYPGAGLRESLRGGTRGEGSPFSNLPQTPQQVTPRRRSGPPAVCLGKPGNGAGSALRGHREGVWRISQTRRRGD